MTTEERAAATPAIAPGPSYLHLQCSFCGRRERLEIREGTIDDASLLAQKLGWTVREYRFGRVSRCPQHPFTEEVQ